MSHFETDFGRWVVERRWWMIAATVLIVLAAGSGIRDDDLATLRLARFF